ncbi:MAG: nucleotidyl transferase AbiEii/AbiGii toxin family protein [Patescibacteria group bacterium]
MMYKLENNPILLPHQVSILKQFFASPISQSFFLTGGTALSAFYFGHRESRDFDLFSSEEFSMPLVEALLRTIAANLGASISVKVATNMYREMYLEHKKDGWIQRVDVVREQPIHFGDISLIDGIRVDSLENIGSNKILTLFSRLEVKDYVDFYTIITKSKLSFDALFALAKQKDTGLNEFYFAQSITAIEQLATLPVMKIFFDRLEMVSYFKQLSRELLLRIKPK